MTMENEIEGIITWVYTRNLDESSRFYSDVLGFQCIRDEGIARIFRVTGQAMIGVCTEFEDRVVEPRGSMITIVCDDVDSWHQRLLEAGACITADPHVLERFGIYTFFAEDPDGYVIEFQQFLDQD